MRCWADLLTTDAPFKLNLSLNMNMNLNFEFAAGVGSAGVPR
jgi:hypothetical protein